MIQRAIPTQEAADRPVLRAAPDGGTPADSPSTVPGGVLPRGEGPTVLQARFVRLPLAAPSLILKVKSTDRVSIDVPLRRGIGTSEPQMLRAA